MRCHVSKDRNGNTRMMQCHATVRACPLGGDEIHHEFADYASMQMWNDCQRDEESGIPLASIKERLENGGSVPEDEYFSTAEEGAKLQAMGFSMRYGDDNGSPNQSSREEYFSFMAKNGSIKDVQEFIDGDSDFHTADNLRAVWKRVMKSNASEDEKDIRNSIVEIAAMSNFYESSDHILAKDGYNDLADDDKMMLASAIEHDNTVYKSILRDAAKNYRDDPDVMSSLRMAKSNQENYRSGNRADNLENMRAERERSHIAHTTAGSTRTPTAHSTPMSSSGGWRSPLNKKRRG